MKNSHRRKKQEWYEENYKRQHGRCMICRRLESDIKSSLVMDHDHYTGKLRALLCCNCNSLLGLAKESIETLQSAIWYLQMFREQPDETLTYNKDKSD